MFPDHLVPLVLLEQKEHLEHQQQVVQVEHRQQVVRPELLEHLAKMEHQELLRQVVQVEHRLLLEHQVRQWMLSDSGQTGGKPGTQQAEPAGHSTNGEDVSVR